MAAGPSGSAVRPARGAFGRRAGRPTRDTPFGTSRHIVRRGTLTGTMVAAWVPLTIAAERCKACELCVLACPHDALALDDSVVNRLGYHPISLVAPERCTSCAFCARVCPDVVFTIYAPRKGVAA